MVASFAHLLSPIIATVLYEMKRLQRKRWMNGWLLVMLLSVAPHTLSYAEDAIPRRVLVGLNLFPNILSVTKGGTAQQTGSDEIELLVVYQKEAKQAKVKLPPILGQRLKTIFMHNLP